MNTYARYLAHQIPDEKLININMTLLDHYLQNGESEEKLRKEKRRVIKKAEQISDTASTPYRQCRLILLRRGIN